MGLPGLLCAKLGATQVLLTDYEPQVVGALRQNAELSGVAPACSFLALDWFNLSSLAPHQQHAYDLLLLADVIYAAAVVGPLVATLQALLKPDSGVLLPRGSRSGCAALPAALWPLCIELVASRLWTRLQMSSRTC